MSVDGLNIFVVCYRSNDCDIRIQLPSVGLEHCRLEVNENKEVIYINFYEINGSPLIFYIYMHIYVQALRSTCIKMCG